MGHAFEEKDAVEIPATPEEVWEAIATGPGLDSWFLGRSEVDPGPGGVVRTVFGERWPDSRVAAWEPPHRLVHGVPEAPDGRFVAYEFLVEGRDHGSTVLRMVTSGFLPGDDWADEFDAMTKGGALFFGTLGTYLTHFRGRTAAPVTVFGPMVTDWDAAWAVVREALGLDATATAGDRVHAELPGLPVIDGVVYHVNEHTLGIRTDDAMYRFIRGLFGSMIVGHHLFAPDADPDAAEAAWGAWLAARLG